MATELKTSGRCFRLHSFLGIGIEVYASAELSRYCHLRLQACYTSSPLIVRAFNQKDALSELIVFVIALRDFWKQPWMKETQGYDFIGVSLSSRWFHPNLTRFGAEKRLRSEPEGSFLVRNSETLKNEYSLTVK